MALNATSFINLIYALDMADEILQTDGQLTLLLPTNDVFVKLNTDAKDRLKDQCFLRRVIRHHFLKGNQKLKTLKDREVLNTLNNKPVTFFQLGKVR